MGAGIHIRLVGGLAVHRGTTDLQIDARPRVVLSYLAANQLRRVDVENQPMRQPLIRADVVKDLWSGDLRPKRQSDNPPGSFNSALYELRTLLTLPDIEGDQLISRDPVQFHPAITIDVEEALQRICHARHRETPTARVQQLVAGLTVWQDRWLPERHEEIFTELRNLHAKNFCRAVSMLADICNSAESEIPHVVIRQAIAVVESCVEHQPLEALQVSPYLLASLYGARMRLALMADDPHAAQRLDSQMRKLPELTASNTAAVDAVRPRIQEAMRRKHPVHQKTAASHSIATFVGYRGAVDQLAERLIAHPPLVTLTGPPGVGKTRWAREITRHQKTEAEFGSHNIHVVLLQDLADNQAIPRAILQSVTTDLPDMVTPAMVIAALSDTPKLLVLDNCEPLLARDSDLQDFIAALLTAVPTLTCLTTSQHLIGLPQEEEVGVPPLPIPSSDLSADQLRHNESVQLFSATARRYHDSFRVTARNAADVQQVCMLLDGLPLAIILVASRSKDLTPYAMRHKLVALTRQESPASKEQRYATLHAALQMSFEQLPAADAALFCALAIFRGGWTAHAAHEVYAQGSTDLETFTSVLDRLEEYSLIEFRLTGVGVRYTMLEPIRAFGTVERPPNAGMYERYTRYFTTLAVEAKSALNGSEQARWLEKLEYEYANLCACLDYLKTKKRVLEALSLCSALQHFCWRRGYLAEGRRYSAAVLALSEQAEPSRELVAVLDGASTLARMQGDYSSAEDLAQQALTLCDLLDAPTLRGSMLSTLSVVAKYRGEYAHAKALLAQALACLRDSEDLNGVSIVLNNLAALVHDQSDYSEALRLLTESLELNRHFSNDRSFAEVLNNLGRTLKAQGDYDQAEVFYMQALTIHTTLSDKRGLARLHTNLGNLASERGNSELARQRHTQALNLYTEIGDSQGIATTLLNLGNAVRLSGDLTTARALFEQSLARRLTLGNLPGVAIVQGNLGYLAYVAGDLRAASQYLHKCLPVYCMPDQEEYLVWILEGYALIALGAGKERASAYFNAAAVTLRHRIGHPMPPEVRAWYTRTMRTLEDRASPEELTRWHTEGVTLSQDTLNALADDITTELAGTPNAPPPGSTLP